MGSEQGRPWWRQVLMGGKRRWVQFTGHLSVGFILLAAAGWLGFFGDVPSWKVVGMAVFGAVAGGLSLWLEGGDGAK